MSAIAAVQILTAAGAALAIGWLLYTGLRRRSLINRGYGIAAVADIDAGALHVEAKVIRIADVSQDWAEGVVTDKAYTVITVDHDLEIAGPTRHQGEDADSIDPESLEALLGPVSDAGIAQAAISLKNLGFVRGVVQVGPNHIRFVEPGDLLEPEYLRAVVAELVRLGQPTDEPAPKEMTAA
ncbi:MAG: hypothetical protein O2826_12335 [Chloroflexi bacterium]|nr:hypothetical protein [Chloroflexota bacterium]MDA1175286.1 hypothetical protein [Chloroflexota bacterium]